MKKIFFAVLMMIFAGSSALVLAYPQTANAAGCASEGAQLFKIPAWYRGLVDEDCEIKPIDQDGKAGSVTIQQFVWTIIGNIFDGIFRIVGVVAVGYIIWAGFQYMIAAGDSSKMAAAKTTIANAIVGLIIAIVASGIVQLVMGVF